MHVGVGASGHQAASSTCAGKGWFSQCEALNSWHDRLASRRDTSTAGLRALTSPRFAIKRFHTITDTEMIRGEEIIGEP